METTHNQPHLFARESIRIDTVRSGSLAASPGLDLGNLSVQDEKENKCPTTTDNANHVLLNLYVNTKPLAQVHTISDFLLNGWAQSSPIDMWLHS